MSHSITPPRSDRRVAIVDMDGTPLSWHVNHDAAERKVQRDRNAFTRRGAGRCGGYLPRSIVSVPAEGAYIERTGPYSTYWTVA